MGDVEEISHECLLAASSLRSLTTIRVDANSMQAEDIILDHSECIEALQRPRMLAAIWSLYASGTISMKIAGAAGPARTQQNGVRQGCPLSPTLFGTFFDGLHDHLHMAVQLDSGRWVSSLIYADDVVLLSWSSAGLQRLLNSMQAFCNQLGLTISSSKTEVMVFNGISTDTWFLGEHALPRSTTFKYLGLIFHESGDMSHAFARLDPKWQRSLSSTPFRSSKG